MMLWLLLPLLIGCALAACPSRCICASTTSGNREISCPNTQESFRIFVTHKPQESIFTCYGASREDWNLLEDLRLSETPKLFINQCPFPPVPLKNITNLMNATFLTIRYANLTNQVPHDFLRGMTRLKSVNLDRNGITDLPVDLFKDQLDLISLNLAENSIKILPRGLFDTVGNLTRLELGANEIEEFDSGVLSLANLKLLNLWKNPLKRMRFVNLTKLEALDLHSNGLEDLPKDVFRELKTLKNLSLQSNNFSTLDEGLFAPMENLENLRLNFNKCNITLTDRLFAGLKKLKIVQLDQSGISQLPENLFVGSPSLTNLTLVRNRIEKLPLRLLADQSNLLELDLSRNVIAEIPEGFFQSLSKLTVLNVEYNMLTNISMGLFFGLRNLRVLKISHNQLTVVHAEALSHCPHLQIVDMSFNMLSFLNDKGFVEGRPQYVDEFGNTSPFQNCLELEHLNLRNNCIIEVFQDWRNVLTRLKTLDLSFNNITGPLQVTDVSFLARQIQADFRHNRIESLVGLSSLKNRGEPLPGSPIPVVLLGDNPIDCNCLAYEMSQYVNYELPSAVYGQLKIDFTGVLCAGPKSLKNRYFTDVKPLELVCEVPKSAGCPESCYCAVRPYDKANIVNCSDLGIKEYPCGLPIVGWTNHTELWVERNNLTTLPDRSKPGYENVTHFFLSHNQIQSLNVSALNNNTQVLLFDHNNITRLDGNTARQLENMTDLRLITLHGNPWICDCEADNFLHFILARYKKISFLNDVKCKDGRLLSKLTLLDLCPPPTALILSGSAVAAICGIIGALAGFYYRYKQNIHVWLYAHQWCLWLVTEEELDKDKRFDAFVSFSHKDEDFVVQELVPRLEAEGLTLCLHYRDWLAGEWIPNQIARSVEESRRTLVVLSPSFLESVWGKMEFRTAHKQALSEGRARVVMLLYGDLPPSEQLDPELQAYISMNTYVKWGDPWFWDKLRYALPHAPLSKKEKLERIELMNPKLSPTAIPTTPPAFSSLPPVKGPIFTMQDCEIGEHLNGGIRPKENGSSVQRHNVHPPGMDETVHGSVSLKTPA